MLDIRAAPLSFLKPARLSDMLISVNNPTAGGGKGDFTDHRVWGQVFDPSLKSVCVAVQLIDKMKKHDLHKISAMLLRYEDLTSRGQSQKAVCNELGISVMTLHRWRKHFRSEDVIDTNKVSNGELVTRLVPEEDDNQIDQLRIENGRLRRIVSDLLLEKMKIQEVLDKARK